MITQTSGLLHLTNGDAAAARLEAAALPGAYVRWRDILHEGPVPGLLSLAELRAVRAVFLANAQGAAFQQVLSDFTARDTALINSRKREEAILWFEHDLYDQLQLLQILDALATQPPATTRYTLVCNEEYLSALEPAQITDRYLKRQPVTVDMLRLAQRGWAAFRSSDAREIELFLATDTTALPFLAAALTRHLEEFPDLASGLARSERQILEVLNEGPATPARAHFAAHQRREKAVYLGDATFCNYLVRLGSGSAPLIKWLDGSLIGRSLRVVAGADFFERNLRLTTLGKRVLAGKADWVAEGGIDRWLGGVHLQGTQVAFRWDADAGRLRAG